MNIPHRVQVVAHEGLTLQFASARLRDDPEVVWAAIGSEEDAPLDETDQLRQSSLAFASDRLRGDREFMMGLIGKVPTARGTITAPSLHHRCTITSPWLLCFRG